ncbi:MAG: NUDIX domain-containing protein [Thermomicrobiales bacterium]
MPKIVSDLVDTYLFRKINARPQFLVLRRRAEAPRGDVWQSIHTRVAPGETAIDAARRDVQSSTGLVPIRFYSADYVAQFYDHGSDSIVLAPTLAAQVNPKSPVIVAPEYSDYAWCDLEETTSRLIYSAQRWAVRHIYDVIAMGGEESDVYSI